MFFFGIFVIGIETGVASFEKTYGGPNKDWGGSVQQTSDGGYIIAGGTVSYGAGGYDVYLLKIDNTGATQWTKTYGGTNDDEGYSVQQTSDDGYIIVGYTEIYDVCWSRSYNGIGAKDVYLLKVDNTGATQWTKTYGGSSDDIGNSVQQTLDGGYIIVGSTESYGAGGVMYIYSRLTIQVQYSGQKLMALLMMILAFQYSRHQMKDILLQVE